MQVEASYRAREEFMDIFRGLGIIVMIMGHISNGFGDKFDYFIHAFHMPMFFFVSGYFFRSCQNESPKVLDYIYKKVKTLIVPYIFFGLFHYIIWLIFIWDNSVIDFYNPLLHLISYNTFGLPIAGALWFLTALFGTNIIYFFIESYVNNSVIKDIIVIMISLLGNITNFFFPDDWLYKLPFAFDASLVGCGFFHIAYTLKSEEKGIRKRIFNFSPMEQLGGAIICVILIFTNDSVNMRTGEYGIIPLFWVNAIWAIILGINLSKDIIKLKKCPLINYLTTKLAEIGKNSIIYLGMNQLIIAVVTKFFRKIKLPIWIFPVVILFVTILILKQCETVFQKTKLKMLIGKYTRKSENG